MSPLVIQSTHFNCIGHQYLSSRRSIPQAGCIAPRRTWAGTAKGSGCTPSPRRPRPGVARESPTLSWFPRSATPANAVPRRWDPQRAHNGAIMRRPGLASPSLDITRLCRPRAAAALSTPSAWPPLNARMRGCHVWMRRAASITSLRADSACGIRARGYAVARGRDHGCALLADVTRRLRRRERGYTRSPGPSLS